MIEPEIAFCDLEQNMDIMEDMLKYIVKTVLEKCSDEIEFLNKFVDKTLKEKLTKLVNSKFTRITHEEVITILKIVKLILNLLQNMEKILLKNMKIYNRIL